MPSTSLPEPRTTSASCAKKSAGAQWQLVAVKFDDTALGQFILMARALIAEAGLEKAA